jgi:hypothetical protein
MSIPLCFGSERMRNYFTSLGYWSDAMDEKYDLYFELLNHPNMSTFPAHWRKNSKVRNIFGGAITLSLEVLKQANLGDDGNLSAIWAPTPAYTWSVQYKAIVVIIVWQTLVPNAWYLMEVTALWMNDHQTATRSLQNTRLLFLKALDHQ